MLHKHENKNQGQQQQQQQHQQQQHQFGSMTFGPWTLKNRIGFQHIALILGI